MVLPLQIGAQSNYTLGLSFNLALSLKDPRIQVSANCPGVNGQGLVCVYVYVHTNKRVSVCDCLYVCVHVCVCMGMHVSLLLNKVDSTRVRNMSVVLNHLNFITCEFKTQHFLYSLFSFLFKPQSLDSGVCKHGVHPKMGTIKDKHGRARVDAEENKG